MAEFYKLLKTATPAGFPPADAFLPRKFWPTIDVVAIASERDSPQPNWFMVL